MKKMRPCLYLFPKKTQKNQRKFKKVLDKQGKKWYTMQALLKRVARLSQAKTELQKLFRRNFKKGIDKGDGMW